MPLLMSAAFPVCDETEVKVLSYNIHGLPSEHSDADPENIKQISPLLNKYDIVMIQEDFVYHQLLSQEAEHPYQKPLDKILEETTNSEEPNFEIKNGLSSFSKFPIGEYYGQRWHDCYGLTTNSRDCLAPKGFSVAEYQVLPGVAVDVYGCHMDAGGDAEDIAARQQQIVQLARFINFRSQYKGVILACDTNLGSDDQHDLEVLLNLAGLQDSCQTLECPEPHLIDRIMYRSSLFVKIEPTNWYIPSEFVNEEGEPLSDHRPVAVKFTISLVPPQK